MTGKAEGERYLPESGQELPAVSGLAARLAARQFAVTAEIGPPRGASLVPVSEKAASLHGWVDAVNITDNQRAAVRLSRLAGSIAAARAGVEPTEVEDVILEKSGLVAGVVLDVGTFIGMGGKYVSVSLNDMKMNNDRLTLDRTKDQLKSAPAYHLDNNKS